MKINPQLIGLWAHQAALADTCVYLLRAYNEAAERFNQAAAEPPSHWLARSLRLRACTLVQPLPGSVTSQPIQLQLL